MPFSDLSPATAVKMAEMDLTLQNVKDDVSETKLDVKALFAKLEVIANTQVMVTNLQESLNNTVRRSDERWAAHLAEFREQNRETKEWRKATEQKQAVVDTTISRYRGMFATANWVFGIALSIIMGVIGWKLK